MRIYGSETLRVLTWKRMKPCFLLPCSPLTLLHMFLNLRDAKHLLGFMKKYLFLPYLFAYLPQMSTFPGLVQMDFYTLPVTIAHQAYSPNTRSIEELALGARDLRVLDYLSAQIHRNPKVQKAKLRYLRLIHLI